MHSYWKENEDALLKDHVKIHGAHNWKVIADKLERPENSCYIRYRDHLRPGIDHSDITEKEGKTIIRLHKKYGNQWKKIVKELSEMRSDNPERTANKVKNFCNKLKLNHRVDSTEDCDDPITYPAIATLPPPDFCDYTAGAYSLMLEDNIGNGMEINNDNGAYSSVPPMNWPPENYNGDGSIYEVVRQYV